MKNNEINQSELFKGLQSFMKKVNEKVIDTRFDQSNWNPDDKDWMEKRKTEWRHVYQSLMNMNGRLQKNAFPYVKDYFFFGKEPGRVYHIPFLLKLWFYPGELEALLPKLLNCSSAGELDSARRRFFENASRQNYSSSDGMMRGREKLIARFYFPSEYSDEVLLLKDSQGYTEKYKVCRYSPESFIRESLIHLRGFIKNSSNSSPFEPYQYLLDHLFSCIEYIQGDFDDRTIFNVEHFFRELLVHTSAMEDSINIQNANKLAQKFLQRLNAPDVDERLKYYWEQARIKGEAE